MIAVGNQKGGCGKTTVTAHLAAAFGELGLSVLAIDLDMNYGLTQHFGVDPEAFLGTFEVLTGDASPEDVIVTSDDEGVELPVGVHLVPSRRRLEDIDRAIAAKSKFLVRQDLLVRPLNRLLGLGRYDIILMDTAPNATTPTLAAYRSTKWFLLTAMPDPFGIRGLNDALQDIRAAQENGNPELRMLGVVLTAVDKRTRLASLLGKYVEQTFAPVGARSYKFATEVSRSTMIPTAQREGRTLFQMNTDHTLTHQFRALAQECVDRLQDRASHADASRSTPTHLPNSVGVSNS